MKKACVLLADGFEELEAVTIIDVLRRADVHVTILALSGQKARGAHELVLEADQPFELNQDHWDLVALPGGQPGANHLRDHPGVRELLRRQSQSEGLLAAICAGPIALSAAECIGGRRVTCFPGYEDQLVDAKVVDEDVVHDGKLITGRGPGVALEFSLKLVELLVSPHAAKELGQKMVFRKS
jgi:4-methyl-5(b-hydroxyethyl)-thiazole monophosphate biosynthesis